MMRQGEGVIILLLEDDPAHAEAIRRALEASDLKAVVHVAGTLREYHEAIAVRLPDIVLMDMVLPDGRALDVLTSPPDACPFPILLMTSYGNEQTAVQAMKAGALDYIVKSPEAFASMPHAVERALREWNMFQQRKRAKAALRESEERFRTLYENSTLGLYRTTPDGRIVLANPALVNMLGYSSFDDLSGRDLKTDGFESSYPRAQFVEMVEKEDAVMGLESVWKRRDGTTIFVRESARAIRGPEGQIIYFDGTVEDVTSRKAAEEKLAYEQNLLRALLENATDQVYFKDKDSQFIRISQAQADRLGLSDPAQAEHKSDFDYFNEDHARQAFLDEQEVMRTGRPLVDLEEKETTLDGRVTWVSTTKVPLRDTQGQILGTFGMSRDVTERKQTEEALRESEERFRTLYENSTLGLYRTTTDGRIVLANPALVTMLGYSSFDDLSGMDLKADGFEPSYPRTQFIEMIEKEGAVRGLESAWKRRDGTTVFVRESARAIRDPEGRTVYFDGTVEDITGRKEAEEEVRRKNASLEAINDIFKETLACETSEEVGCLCLNLAQKLTGSKMGFIGEVNAAGGFDTIALSDPGWENCRMPKTHSAVMIKNMKIRGLWGRVITAGKSLVVNQPSSHPDRVGLPEGHPPITAFLGVPLGDAGGTIGMISLANKESGYSSIDRELVESLSAAFVEALMRKRAEEAQRRVEENYHRSLDDSPLGVRIVTAEGDTLYANKAILDLYGYDSLEELNKTPLKDRYTPQTYAEHQERKDQRLQGASPDGYEISIVRKNGEIRTLQVFRKEVLWNGGKHYQALYLDITARKDAEKQVQETLQRLNTAMASTIQVLGLTVEARDPYTAGHQQRTTILAEAIAREMGLPPEKIEGLHMAGLVHDIGKISIPAEILSKPTKLTPGEYALVKTHAQRGYEILKDVAFPWPLAEIVYQHHERMDGSGYPRGLKGNEILMEARILSVSDTVEAMVSDRPYRPAQGVKTALAEVEKNKGIFYDADVAETCLKLFREKRFSFPA